MSVRADLVAVHRLLATLDGEALRSPAPHVPTVDTGTGDEHARLTLFCGHLGPPNPDRCADLVRVAAAVQLVHRAVEHHARVRDRDGATGGTDGNAAAILAGDRCIAAASMLASAVGPEAYRMLAHGFAVVQERALTTGQRSGLLTTAARLGAQVAALGGPELREVEQLVAKLESTA